MPVNPLLVRASSRTL